MGFLLRSLLLLLAVLAAGQPALATTSAPSASPTGSPTASPSTSPTGSPTDSPTGSPTNSPTSSPTASPSSSPTPSPASSPPTTSPTLSPDYSPPSAAPTAPPLNCSALASTEKQCASLPATSSCSWVALRVCPSSSSSSNSCRTITYGCQDNAFCEIDPSSFQPKLQCRALSLNCNWSPSTGGVCIRNCPAGVPGKLPDTTRPATCATMQLPAAAASSAAGIKNVQRYAPNTPNSKTDEHFGEALASNADFDGDGKPDMAIGAPDLPPKFSPDRDGTGGVTLRLSSLPGQTFHFVGAHLEGRLGTALEFVDLNGDGLADLVMSAPFANARGMVRSGVVFIIWASANFSQQHRAGAYADLWAADPAFVTRMVGPDSMSNFGGALARAGDFNGDGLADLVVGADAASLPQRYACGQATVVFGSRDYPVVRGAAAERNEDLYEPDGQVAMRRVVFSGKRAFTYFGTSVAGNGDVNGDGLADIVVGAPYMNQGQGEVSVIYGRRDALDFSEVDLRKEEDSTWGFTLTGSPGALQTERFGSAVSIPGDLNLDGFADVAVGAPFFGTLTKTQEMGRTYVFNGGGNASSSTVVASHIINGQSAGDRFGSKLCTNGPVDFNGDGYSDLVVGFPRKSGAGGVAVVYGDCHGITPSAAAVTLGDVSEISASRVLGVKSALPIGDAVYSCGDVNQDGRTDLCLGVPGANSQRGIVLAVVGC